MVGLILAAPPALFSPTLIAACFVVAGTVTLLATFGVTSQNPCVRRLCRASLLALVVAIIIPSVIFNCHSDPICQACLDAGIPWWLCFI